MPGAVMPDTSLLRKRCERILQETGHKIENKSLIKSIDIVGIWIYDEIQIEIERRRWTA